MKIGLINNLYKPYQKGGAERIVELLGDELLKLGHTVFIISTQPKIKKENEEVNAYYLKSNYSELNNLNFASRLIWQLGNLVNLKKYSQVKKILASEKPDLVITHNLMGLGLLTPSAIKQKATRHIHVLHDIQLLHPSGLMYFGHENLINSFFAKIYQLKTNFLFKLGTKKLIVVSPSNWLLTLHQAHGLFKHNQSQVIANPFIKKDVVAKNTSRDFIFIGQLEKHKGVDLFIAAAARFTDYNFLIVGSGSLDIKETINLKVLGQKTSAEVNQLLNNSLAAIIPSRCYENSPTVIYEAAATNTPVIAANLGGIPELIQRFGGLLFEPDNLDSLVMTIQEFINHGAILKTPPESKSYAEELLNLL
jgi:glycosyltransferase involved in cell wall biosynthesis